MHPDQFFEGKEYIIFGSTYTISNISIPAYKPPKSNSLENTLFNQYLLRIRVRVGVDHGIGCLKGKFQSLRRLNICIGSIQDHIRVVLWIKACTILHNLLFESYYDLNWDNVDDLESFDDHPIDPYTYQSLRSKRRGGWNRETIKVRT